MIDRSNYVPMWSVHGPSLAAIGGNGRLYRHFSGRSAERRARSAAEKMGPGHGVDFGMGNRSGWVCAEGWNAEQFIAAVAVLTGKAVRR